MTEEVMQTDHICDGSQLVALGLRRWEYDALALYGEARDRHRVSGAYVNGETRRLKAVRMVVGAGKRLYNDRFKQTITPTSVLWNVPDYQCGEEVVVSTGDEVDVFVALASDGGRTAWQNFSAGRMVVTRLVRGRPNQVLFERAPGDGDRL
jgi:hypothetical protein